MECPSWEKSVLHSQSLKVVFRMMNTGQRGTSREVSSRTYHLYGQVIGGNGQNAVKEWSSLISAGLRNKDIRETSSGWEVAEGLP